jgi:hypothetical protein
VKRLHLFSLCLALIFPLAAISQTPSFSTHSAPDTAEIILHGDVNNDGFEDLVGFSANAFSVLLSNGDGTYRAPITTTVPSGTFPVLLGDFNEDGKLDLVVQNSNTGFSIYFGNGDGTFGAPVAHVVTGQIVTIAAADVNHDNKTDLLIDSSTDGGNTYDVQVLFANGDGTFRTGPTTTNTNAGAGILTGDFNGDGNVDIAALNGSEGYSYIGILIGNDTGTFTQTYSESNGYNFLLVAADVNGDGRTDLIGSDFTYSTNGGNLHPWLAVYYGNPDGTMTPAQIPTANCVAANAAVADFNGDHIPDIAFFETDCTTGTTTTTTTMILSGKGNNQFGSETPVYSTTNASDTLFTFRGNRDTMPDIVFSQTTPQSNGYPGAITTLLNSTSGNFPTCNAPNAATGIALCSPQAGGTVSSPVNFAIGAAGDVAMRKVEVWVDGNKDAQQLADAFSHYSFLDASVPLSAGAHNVTVYAAGWDNSLQSKSFTLNVASSASCSAPTSPGVHVCSPVSGSSNPSPLTVQAASMVTGTITRMEVWVDGVKKYTSTTTNLDTSLTLPAGSHRFDFYAVNTAGQKWETTVYASISATVGACAAPSSDGVHVCSPLNGSSEASPVNAQAASMVSGAIDRMEVWVDGVKKYTSTTTTLNTSVPLAAKTHRFDFYAVNTTGTKWETTVYSTVK